MKRIALVAALAAALVGCRSDSAAPSITAPAAARTSTAALGAGAIHAASAAIPGQYIVVMKPSTQSLTALAGNVVAAKRGRLRYVYSQALVNGFAVSLTDSAAAQLAADPRVEGVYPDVEMWADGAGTQANPQPNLDRIDQTALPLNKSYSYGNDGSGVTIYLLDSGIRYTHVDFGGRAVPGYDGVASDSGASDCAGHGTHLAGVAGGTTYGVAKGVTLVGVQVLDCQAHGSSSAILAGMDWVVKQKKANPTRPMVASMSFSGAADKPFDTGVANLVAAGVTVVVSAGNGPYDACTRSPARAPAAITVAASDNADNFSSLSDYGSCVDIVAPGVGVVSDYISSNTATTVLTGTSVAAPHVAGAAALYLAAHPTATPAQVAAALTTNATLNVLKSLPTGTPNRLLNVSFIAGGTTPVNQSPTAAISAPAAGASVVQGASVTFAGTGTDSEDGALTGASLVWTSSRDGQIGTGASLAKTTLTVGTHTITLTATDSKGAIGAATRTITVTAPANQAPTAAITAPTNGASVVQGASVSFAGTGTDPETGALSGAALVWASSRDGQLGTGASFATTALSVGTHTITLTAKDPQGATGTATRTLTVTAPVNQPPTASITAPATGTSVTQGTSITFTGTGTDPDDGTLTGTSLVWASSRDGQLGTGTSLSTTTLSLGTHAVTLTATDSKGATSTTTTSVTVTAPSGGTNQPPVAAFTMTCPTKTCTADASASTDDAGIVSYYWTFRPDKKVTVTAPTTTILYGLAGTYNVTLTVTDAAGLTSTVTKQVRVP